MKIRSVRAWELERYLLSELPPQRMEEIEQLLQNNPELKSELTRLQKSDEDILKKFPKERMIPNIQSRYETEKAQVGRKNRPAAFKRLLYVSPVLASALVILFIVLFKPHGDMPQNTRIKGTSTVDPTNPHILVHRKMDSDSELLGNGDRAKAGDLLQIAYSPAGKSYGVILSIDGNGLVTLHFPDNRSDSTLLQNRERVLLESAYELDDAPQFERFFFITAQTQISVESILDKANSLAENPEKAKTTNLDLPDAYDQFTTLIIKGE
ncbi:anti-sigma factor family protein [Acidobacteriota bacterium]